MPRVNVMRNGKVNPTALKGMAVNQLTGNEQNDLKEALAKSERGTHLSAREVKAVQAAARTVKAPSPADPFDKVKRDLAALDAMLKGRG